MEGLSEFELEVLENLPVEPTGLSLAELADGVLDDRSPRARGRIRRALSAIDGVLGCLHVSTGNDDFGRYAVRTYAIRQSAMPAVRQLCNAAHRGSGHLSAYTGTSPNGVTESG